MGCLSKLGRHFRIFHVEVAFELHLFRVEFPLRLQSLPGHSGQSLDYFCQCDEVRSLQDRRMFLEILNDYLELVECTRLQESGDLRVTGNKVFYRALRLHERPFLRLAPDPFFFLHPPLPHRHLENHAVAHLVLLGDVLEAHALRGGELLSSLTPVDPCVCFHSVPLPPPPSRRFFSSSRTAM